MRNKEPYIAIAPMMDWTDRHCRYFHRLISPHVRLYTEMVTTGAILYGNRARLLSYDPTEHPIALQLGGSSPADLAACAKIGEDFGYDEINLNCGCPSDRVQNGMFGACLMARPELVGECIAAMRASVRIPVTVKCRIGIDDQDSFEFLHRFIHTNAEAGCKTFTIHARKAWLSGLSPKENREIPPLDYERVANIKQTHPKLRIILNGGIKTIETVRENLTRFDGVMIGREAYQNPYFLADLEHELFDNGKVKSRETIARAMIRYAREQEKRYGTPVKSITRHILGLYHGQPGAKQWKRTLSTLPYETGARADVIEAALSAGGTAQKQRINA